MSTAEAEAALSSVQLALGDVEEHYVHNRPVDFVFSQMPQSGSKIAYHTPVDISLSLGPWTGEDTTPPQVEISASPDTVKVGETVTLVTSVVDDVSISSTSLLVKFA